MFLKGQIEKGCFTLWPNNDGFQSTWLVIRASECEMAREIGGTFWRKALLLSLCGSKEACCNTIKTHKLTSVIHEQTAKPWFFRRLVSRKCLNKNEVTGRHLLRVNLSTLIKINYTIYLTHECAFFSNIRSQYLYRSFKLGEMQKFDWCPFLLEIGCVSSVADPVMS